MSNITLNNVQKAYGNKVVLDQISLEIKDGQYVALLGPSGCGKTTLINALAGLTDIDKGIITSGEIRWSEPGYTLAAEARNVGMVFQDYALWPHMNVYENLAFSQKIRKTSNKEIRIRVAEALETVQMLGFEKRYPHELSGGQRQRVAIARALVARPSVLLMDEPLSSLDAQLREKMRWELLRIIRDAGITTIYVTHDQIEALSMADYLVLLNGGRIEQAGRPAQLYHEPATVFAATFLGCSNILEGKTTEVYDKYTAINCHGKKIYTSGCLSPNEKDKIMIRPADIMINTRSQGVGSLLDAVIQQRSFQGVNWQYRVTLKDSANIHLEVWDTQEMAISELIQLWLPADRCRLLSDETYNNKLVNQLKAV